MIYIVQILLLAFAFISGVHDGMTHDFNRSMSNKWRSSWHIKGGVLFAIVTAMAVMACGWWMILSAIFARIALFDIGYATQVYNRKNKYIGDGREFYERAMISIFGKDGGYIKAFVFLTAIIILNYFLCKN